MKSLNTIKENALKLYASMNEPVALTKREIATYAGLTLIYGAVAMQFAFIAGKGSARREYQEMNRRQMERQSVEQLILEENSPGLVDLSTNGRFMAEEAKDNPYNLYVLNDSEGN